MYVERFCFGEYTSPESPSDGRNSRSCLNVFPRSSFCLVLLISNHGEELRFLEIENVILSIDFYLKLAHENTRLYLGL